LYRLLIVGQTPESLYPLRDELAREGYQAKLCAPDAPSLADACAARTPEVLFWDARLEEALLNRFRDIAQLAKGGASTLLIALLSPPFGASPSLPKEADDLLFMPARPGEALIRLAFLLQRLRGAQPDHALDFDGLTIDLANYAVSQNGSRVELTYKEYELLRFLSTHSGRVYNRETLLQQVWGNDYFGGVRTVDVHIRRLRAKLSPTHDHLIETVRNVGYRFAA
jgi:DNA-binding response OmpR family regulator